MGGFRKVGRRKKATKKRVEREKEENITRKAEIDAAKVKQAAVEAERRECHQKVLESRGLLGLALRDSLHGVGAVQKARRDAADGEDDAHKAKSAYSRLLSLLPQARFNFAVEAEEGTHDTEGEDAGVSAPVAVGGGKRKRAPGSDAAGGSNRKKRREAEGEEEEEDASLAGKHGRDGRSKRGSKLSGRDRRDEEDDGSDGEASDAISGSGSSENTADASSDDEAELGSGRAGGMAASVKASAKSAGKAKAKGGDEDDEEQVVSTTAGPDLFELRYLQNPPPAATAGPAATSFVPVPFFKLAAAHCGVGWDAASELQLLAAGAAAVGLSSSAEPAGTAAAASAAPALSYLAALTASDVEKLKVAGSGAAPASSAAAAASSAAPEASLPYDPCTFALGPGYPPVLREGGLAEAHRVLPKLAAAWGETYGHEAHKAAVEAARKVQRAFRRAAERHAAALTVAAGAGAGAGGAKKRGGADSSKAAAAEAEAAAVLAAASAVRITPAKGRYPFTPLQYALWSPLASYRDVYYAARTASNARELRTVTSLHVLNHVVRARDTVAKNNGRSRAAAAAARLARLEKASALGAVGAGGGKGGGGKGKGKEGALPLLLAREAAAAAGRGEADDEAAPAAAGAEHGKAAAAKASSVAASRPGGLPLLLARELEAQGSGSLDAEEGHLLSLLEDEEDAPSAAGASASAAAATAAGKLGKAGGSGTAAPAGGKGKAAAAAAAAATTIHSGAEGEGDCKDSGYTRPRVLVLLPFRHSALQWVRSMLRLLPGRHVQNRNRFFREFSEEGSGLGGEEEDDDADAKAAAKARATGAAAGLPASVLASISRQEQQMMSDLEESDGEAQGEGAGSSSAGAKGGDDAGSGDEEGDGAEGKRGGSGASAAAAYPYNRSRQGWTAKTVAQAKAEKRRAAAAAAAGEADDEEDEEEEESEEEDDDAEGAADAPLSALAATAGRRKTDDRIIKEGAVKFDGRGRRIRPRRKRKVRKGKGGMVGAATAAPAQQPLDYRQAFAGNIDDDFKVGISINGRKSVKLFADFYSADILVASPLGLRRLVGGEGDKKRETDFLSSIEVLVLDAAEVLLQQNWGHVRDIMALLNATPRSTAHVDFSRVRELHLEGRAAEVRQTLCFSGYMAPDITALMRRQCKNSGLTAPAGAALTGAGTAAGASKKKGAAAAAAPAATSTALVAAAGLAPSVDVGGGSLLFRCRYEGTISRVVPTVRQVFQRIAADSVAAADDARFAYFRDTLLPELQAGVSSDTGSVLSHTLIFCPSYFEYVRLRNLLDARELEFVTACEYSEDADVTRARTRFYAGHSPLLLTTERFHFFRRLRLRGARHLLFYGPPAACVFYPELVNGLEEASARGHPISVTVLYTQADAAALERVVGSDRAGRMLAPGAKSSHHFV